MSRKAKFIEEKQPNQILRDGLSRTVEKTKASWGIILNTGKGWKAVRLSAGAVPPGLNDAVLDRPLWERQDVEEFLSTFDIGSPYQILSIPPNTPHVPLTTVEPPAEFMILSDVKSYTPSRLQDRCDRLGGEVAWCRDHFASNKLRDFTRLAGQANTIADVASALCEALNAKTMRTWVPAPALSSEYGEVLELWWTSDARETSQLHRIYSDLPSFAIEVLRSGAVLIASALADPQKDGQIEIQVDYLSDKKPYSRTIAARTYEGSCDNSLLGIPVKTDSKTIAVIVFSGTDPFAFRSQRIAYLFEHLAPILAPLFERLIRLRQNALFEKLRGRLIIGRADDSLRMDSVDNLLRALVDAMNAQAGAFLNVSGKIVLTHGTFDATTTVNLSEQVQACVERHSCIAVPRKRGEFMLRLYPITLRHSARSIRYDVMILATLGEAPPLLPTGDNVLPVIQSLIDDHLHSVAADEHLGLAEDLQKVFVETRGEAKAFYRRALAIVEKILFAKCSLWQCESEAHVFLPDNEAPNALLRNVITESRKTGSPVVKGRLLAVPVGRSTHIRWVLGCQRLEVTRPFCALDVDCAVLCVDQATVFARTYQALIERDQVIATVPHELRVPISAITDALIGLEDAGPMSTITQDIFRTIEKANDLSGLLIEHLLCATGKNTWNEGNLEPIRLVADILEPVVRLVRLVGDKDYLRGDSFDVRGAKIDEFLGHRGTLMCVFYNLFWNAVKYHKLRQATFELRVHAVTGDDGGWTILVHDWGIGVPAGWEDRIFERGVRAPNVKTKTAGLGLGLYIARMLARSWGGALTLKKSANPTTFEVSFPAALFTWRQA
jgi:nitrogen-specific signal transduction histidine kinase